MAKLFVKLAALAALTGFVLIIVGLATPYWLKFNGYHQGLWRYCYAGAHGTSDTCHKLDSHAFFDWKVWATRILTILASVASFISLVLMVVYLQRNDGLANLRRIKAVTVFSIICAVLVFIGIGVYASWKKDHDSLLSLHFHDYSWSFIVTIVGGALHLLLILGLFLEIKASFKEELLIQVEASVEMIVEKVMVKLEKKISDLACENIALKNDNKVLKKKVENLETQVDSLEQYSRRNSIRITGVPEVAEGVDENTDEYVLKMCEANDVKVELGDIDRSHRVGKRVTPQLPDTKPRAIIVKFATYRARRAVFKARTNLKNVGYKGVFINEDLTKPRSTLLYHARQLAKD